MGSEAPPRPQKGPTLNRSAIIRRILISVFSIALGIAILWVIFAQSDVNLVLDSLRHARFGYVLPAVGILVLAMLTRAFRWRALLGTNHTVRDLFGILSISYLFNGFLPLRLGEPIRILLIARHPQSVSPFQATASILVERLIDAILITALLGFLLPIVAVPVDIQSAGIGLGLISCVLLLALVVLGRYPGLIHKGAALLGSPQRLSRYLQQFHTGLEPFASVSGASVILFWTAVSWFLSVASCYVLMYALYPQASWTAAMLIIVMAALAVSVPSAPGSIGPFEAAVVLALTILNYDTPPGSALAFAVLLHAVQSLDYLILGIYGLADQRTSLDLIRHETRAVLFQRNGTAHD